MSGAAGFIVEEGGFAGEAPAVAGGFLVGAHGAVAGDEDGDFVFGAGVGDGARGARGVDLFCELGVSAGLAGEDFPEGVPDAELEGGALGRGGDGGGEGVVFVDGLEQVAEDGAEGGVFAGDGSGGEFFAEFGFK